MNTTKFLKSKTKNGYDYIRSYLYKNYIKTIEERNDLDECRLLFIANRYKSDFLNPISFECNGLITEYNKKTEVYKTLVIPVELFNSKRLIKSEINKYYNMDKYNIYKVYDGTIINLYYYKNQWRLSTNKTYDANNLIMVNNKTYLDVFNELIEMYPNFDINKIDKNKCYTLCMKYDKFHTFIENQYNTNTLDGKGNKIIFMQSIDMEKFNIKNKLEINENEDIGLPISEKYDLSNINNINQIYNSLEYEISRFKLEKSKQNYVPNFGIILRTKTFDTTKDYSNILIESNLMSKIRNILYNHAFTKNLYFKNVLSNKEEKINKKYYNMEKLIMLKIFLTKKDWNLYILLFSQHKEQLKEYEIFFKYLTKYIIENYNIFNINNTKIDKIFKDELDLDTKKLKTQLNINYNKINKLSFLISTELKNKKINLNVNENYDILYDFICNPIYIDYYYSYFN